MEHLPEYVNKYDGNCYPEYVNKHGGNGYLFRWVVCSCGWAHMINVRHWAPLDRDRVLKGIWYRHAYTPEEQAILRELEGDG